MSILTEKLSRAPLTLMRQQCYQGKHRVPSQLGLLNASLSYLFTDENMCREKEVSRLYGCNGKGELVKGASGLININVLCISIFSHIFLFVFPLLYFSLHL